VIYFQPKNARNAHALTSKNCFCLILWFWLFFLHFFVPGKWSAFSSDLFPPQWNIQAFKKGFFEIPKVLQILFQLRLLLVDVNWAILAFFNKFFWTERYISWLCEHLPKIPICLFRYSWKVSKAGGKNGVFPSFLSVFRVKVSAFSSMLSLTPLFLIWHRVELFEIVGWSFFLLLRRNFC